MFQVFEYQPVFGNRSVRGFARQEGYVTAAVTEYPHMQVYPGTGPQAEGCDGLIGPRRTGYSDDTGTCSG